MPGCCVPNCPSSFKKGQRMKKFPKDPVRRKLWRDKVNRHEDWNVTNYSVLCENHFQESDWVWVVRRGKKTLSLKPHAIPSVFSPSKFQQPTLPPQPPDDLLTPKRLARKRLKLFHNYSKSPSKENNSSEAPKDTTPSFSTSTPLSVHNEKNSFSSSTVSTSPHSLISPTSTISPKSSAPISEFCTPLPPCDIDITALSTAKLSSSSSNSSLNPEETSSFIFPKCSTPTSRFITPLPPCEIDITALSTAKLSSSSSNSSLNPEDNSSFIFPKCSTPTSRFSTPLPPCEIDITALSTAKLSTSSSNSSLNPEDTSSFIFPKCSTPTSRFSTPLPPCEIDITALSTAKLSSNSSNPSSNPEDTSSSSSSPQAPKLEYFKRKFYQQRAIIKRLRSTISNKERTIKQLTERNDTSPIKKVFNKDQMTCLRRASKRVWRWSTETIKKAFKLRFTCGSSGYSELLAQNQPLPSIRTLQRRIEHVNFESGILHEVIQTLAVKVEAMKEEERDCVLTLDEMSITPQKEFDNTSGSFLGEVTLPNHEGTANHALVVMLAGITSRWKQTVAYYYTGNSADGVVLKKIILQVIKEAEEIMLKVWVVACDMGPSNQAMWRAFGIHCNRTSIQNKIVHPEDPNRMLFFMADVPHVFKNIKKALITHEIINIPTEIAELHSLPSTEANVSHIRAICDHQEDKQMKLVKGLKKKHLSPSHFDKMKVSSATSVINERVGRALKFLIKEGGDPNFATTAWFLQTTHKWFKLMTSRTLTLALSKLNPAVYAKTIQFLKDFIILFRNLEFGADHQKSWKPIQTGVIISTTTILELQEIFLNQKKYQFLLTSRFSQDCLENLFSVVRKVQPIPTPLQFKHHLKLITVSQYIKPTSSSSYDQDDRTFLGEFFEKRVSDSLKSAQAEDKEFQELKTLVRGEFFLLDNTDENCLYNVAGYITYKVARHDKVCEQCVTSLINPDPDEPLNKTYTRLVKLNEFREGCLVKVNHRCFCMFKTMEQHFRACQQLFSQAKDVKALVTEVLSEEIKHVTQPPCHDINKKLLNRFVTFRLRIFGEYISSSTNRVDFGSKSVAMRTMANNVRCNKMPRI